MKFKLEVKFSLLKWNNH